MEMVFLKKYWIKYFNPFLLLSQQALGQDWALVLSYDIITRGHGGELKVETKEGEGAEFIIILPTQ